MPDYLPAGPLSAYLGVRDSNERLGIQRQAADIQKAGAVIGILNHLHAQQQQDALMAAQASGDPNQLMRVPGGPGVLAQLAQYQNAGITGQLNTARIGEINDKIKNSQIQHAALSELLKMNSPESYNQPGMTPVSGVLPPQAPSFAPGSGNPDEKVAPTAEDAAAIAAFRASGADKPGAAPMSMVAPNLQRRNDLLTALDPKAAVSALLRPKPVGTTVNVGAARPVTGGYLERQADGTDKFVATRADPNAGTVEEELTDNGNRVKNDLIRNGLPVPKTRRGLVDNAALNSIGKENVDGPPVSATRADYKSKSNALSQNTKDLTAIRPYNEMLEKNGNIAIDLAQKVIATDSKLANRPINWIRQNAGDNPDTAEFLAQAQIVSTEAARVLNNPRLVGQLTDSARHEMQGIVNGEMPINSFVRVVRRMQADGNNRVSAMVKERNYLNQSLGGQPVPTSAVTGAPTPTTPRVVNFSDLK